MQHLRGCLKSPRGPIWTRETRQSARPREASSPSPSGRGQGEGNGNTLTPAPLPRWGEGRLAVPFPRNRVPEVLFRRRLIGFCLAGLLFAFGCDDRSYREIGANIDILTKKSDGLPGSAIARLTKIGRRAVPQIETALHTASARGKANLIAALAAIGEPESAAILQHFATYDASPEVRAACDEVLAQWAARGDGRSAPAKQAIARVQERRRLGQAQ